MIWIHVSYRIFASGVKPQLLKTGLQANKKGKSTRLDSPSKVVITNGYPKWILNKYRPNHGGSSWLRRLHKKNDITGFGGLRKPLISWRYIRF
jgi:hypothetical protein